MLSVKDKNDDGKRLCVGRIALRLLGVHAAQKKRDVSLDAIAIDTEVLLLFDSPANVQPHQTRERLVSKKDSPAYRKISPVSVASILLASLLACSMICVFTMDRRIARPEKVEESPIQTKRQTAPVPSDYVAHEVERLTSVNGYTSSVNSVSWSADKSQIRVFFSWDPGEGDETYQIYMEMKQNGNGSYIAKLPWPSEDQAPLFITVTPPFKLPLPVERLPDSLAINQHDKVAE